MDILVKNGECLESAFQKAHTVDEPVTIFLSEGEYEVTDTLMIERDDLTIIGANHAVTLKGSKRIPISGLPVENHIVTIDLKANNITNTGQFGEGPFEDFWNVYDIPKPHMTDYGPGLEVFYAGKQLPISRYPKDGFIHISKALGETDITFRNERNGSREGIFLTDDENVKTWTDYSNLMLIGYWSNDWATGRHLIESINPETGAITVKQPYHLYGYRDGRNYFDEKGGKFYAINVKNAISAPGEWAIDRENLKLYLYPYEGQDSIEISCADDLFCSRGHRNLRISGLTVSQCRKSAVMFEDCSDVLISDMNVTNTGAWGILGESCTNMTVQNCDVTLTGGGGIGVNGGDRRTLTPSNNVIKNCTIHEIARWHKTYMAALDISGVGCTLSENYIYDVPHFGIVFAGNNHIIEKNEINNACYESNDAGAIYSGKNYTYRGTIIRHNYLHDLTGGNGNGCVGLYFDDAMASAEVYGNVFARIPYIAILLGGGRDFKIHDNTFFDCKMSIMYDQRAMKNQGLQKRLLERLSEVDHKCDIWKNAYPELYCIEENDMFTPIGNSFTANTVIGGDGFALSSELLLTITDIRDNIFAAPNIREPHDRYHDTGWIYVPES